MEMVSGSGSADGSDENVLGDVHEHRARSPAPRDVESFLQYPAKILAVGDQVVVLGDRARDSHDIGFLEGVIADHVARHLPGEHDERHRVEIGGRQPGHRVGGARSARHQAHAYASGGPGVAVRRMHRPLFVTDQDEPEPPFAVQRVEHRDHDPAGESRRSFRLSPP